MGHIAVRAWRPGIVDVTSGSASCRFTDSADISLVSLACHLVFVGQTFSVECSEAPSDAGRLGIGLKSITVGPLAHSVMMVVRGPLNACVRIQFDPHSRGYWLGQWFWQDVRRLRRGVVVRVPDPGPVAAVRASLLETL